ncbi:MAG: hypothetical protein CMA25_08030 [Euryarchaeota archaeon]|nr:hypothetical protein [Euryarchaeota archaeon]|tara:strand:- start:871 stop:1413 length:543 start_codon:yes stop_codon:yes gene_type:complete
MSELSIHSFGPDKAPNEAYYRCRYKILREPLGFLPGSEILMDDSVAIHAYAITNSEIVGVGRIHLIPPDSNGSQPDHAGPGAAICPPFSPLIMGNKRPAVQIRQMGVLTSNQRAGIGSTILKKLECEAVSQFKAKYGFLQARENAVRFYQSQGWKIIDEPYTIPKIGLHYSMMKSLELSF